MGAKTQMPDDLYRVVLLIEKDGVETKLYYGPIFSKSAGKGIITSWSNGNGRPLEYQKHNLEIGWVEKAVGWELV